MAEPLLTPTRRHRALLGAAVILSLLLLWPTATALSLPSAFGALVPALAVVAAALGFGAAVLRPLGVWPHLGRERWIWAAAAGLGVIGTIQFALSTMHLFVASAAGTVIAVGWIVLGLHRKFLINDLRSLPVQSGGLWLVALAPVAALVLIQASAPPSFYDTLVYHLGLPMQFAARGGLFIGAHDSFTAMPLLFEMAASPALLLGGPEAFGFLSALVWFLFSAAVFVLARRAAGEVVGMGVGAAAAFVTASMPLVVFLSGAAKPDLFGALLCVGILRMLSAAIHEEGGDQRRAAVLRLAATFLGMGCATKTSFLLWSAALAPLLLWWTKTRQLKPRSLLEGAGLVFGWGSWPYLRNAIALGNPVFPFATGVFGGPAWMEHGTALLESDARRIKSLDALVELPWSLIIGADPLSNEVLGLVPLIGIIALLVLRPRIPALQTWFVFGALTLLPWFFTHALPRYNPILWVVLGVSGGIGLEAALRQGGIGRALVGVSLLAGSVNLMWSLAADEVLFRGPSEVILQRSSREQFLAKELAPYRAYAYMNENAPEGCVLLATGDPRIAYLEVPAVVSEVYMRPVPETFVADASDVDDAIGRFRALGVTHVILARDALALWRKRGWAHLDEQQQARFDGFIERLGAPLFDDGNTRVFSFPDPRPGTCLSP